MALEACVKSKGVSHRYPTNGLIRNTNLVIAWHLEKLSRSKPTDAQVSNSLQALSNAVLFAAKHYFDIDRVDNQNQMLLTFELLTQVAQDIKTRNYSKFMLRRHDLVKGYVINFRNPLVLIQQ